MASPTWKLHTTHGDMNDASVRERLPDSAFAFPNKRKEPLVDANHVRNAIARFDQVTGVTDDERDEAWANLREAAKHFKVEVAESDWHDLGKRPHTENAAHPSKSSP